MVIHHIHRLISFKHLFWMLTTLSVSVQVIIISYNHFSGYYYIPDAANFLQRLIYSSVLSLIASFFLAYPDLWMIHRLNRHSPWSRKGIRRSLIELFFSLLIATLAAILITSLAHFIDPYREYYNKVLFTNVLILAVVNLMLVVILEAWIFFFQIKSAEKKAEGLQQELSGIRFEILKNQINPHFLFNSLNVLSGLIEKDPQKAQIFVDEFAMVYRYVLETIEKPLVSLSREIEFVRSYMFLQQIRYGEQLQYAIQIPSSSMAAFLPPLSLQTLFENAIKHNAITSGEKLEISVFTEGNYVVVKNNLRSKKSGMYSSGIGQKNLARRYAILGDYVPLFTVETHHYVAKLPLLLNDKDESTDY
jgi:sensor histidine kinase YesM